MCVWHVVETNPNVCRVFDCVANPFLQSTTFKLVKVISHDKKLAIFWVAQFNELDVNLLLLLFFSVSVSVRGIEEI